MSERPAVILSKRKTFLRGENHPGAKLKNADVLAIAKLLDEGRLTQRAIAKQFGVGYVTISAIKTGKAWRHITGKPDPALRPLPPRWRRGPWQAKVGDDNPNSKLTQFANLPGKM